MFRTELKANSQPRMRQTLPKKHSPKSCKRVREPTTSRIGKAGQRNKPGSKPLRKGMMQIGSTDLNEEQTNLRVWKGLNGRSRTTSMPIDGVSMTTCGSKTFHGAMIRSEDPTDVRAYGSINKRSRGHPQLADDRPGANSSTLLRESCSRNE